MRILASLMSGSAETYRDQAKEIAELAEHADDPSVRAELLALAERFKRLAEYVETHGPSAFPAFGLAAHDRR